MQASDILEIGLRRGFTREQVAAALRGLTDEEVTRLAWASRWCGTRHAHQVEPSGDWTTWLIMAGRGAGKTRVGAEWTGMAAASSLKGEDNRTLVSAPTKSDLRRVCFEGESGLLRVIPSSLIKHHHKSPDPEVMLHNDALIGGIAAETVERFRGPNWHRAWADELAAWGETGRCDPQEAWDVMSFSVRLGDSARILATTTPRNKPHIKSIMADKGTVVTGASTYVNLDNLSPKFRERILKYDGTKIGRQEIYAELIDSEDGGILRRDWLRRWHGNKALPKLELIVMSLDTAYSEASWDKKRQEGDPSASIVLGCFRINNKPQIMLLDCWSEYLGFPDLVDKVKLEKEQPYGETDNRPIILPQVGPRLTAGVGHKTDLIVIEGKASGKSLRQQLAKDGVMTYEYNPGNADKRTRMHIISPIVKDGILWIPESPKRPGQFMSWAEPFVEQVCSFSGEGSVLHDDYVDALTQGLRVIDDMWLHFLEHPKQRMRPDEKARLQQSRVNPYTQ